MQIDQRSSQNVLQVQGPRLWKRWSWWGRVDASDSPATYGRHVLVRLRKQLPPRLEPEAVPNLGLPASIVALDGSLKSGFSQRCEDHRDSQAKAQSRYSPHSIRMSVRSLKNGVVVELGVVGQAELTPVLQQGVEGRFRRDFRPWPRSNQSAMQRDAVEHLDAVAALNDKSFHDVEAIQFGSPPGQLWQVPTGRRRRPASSFATVQRPAPVENTANSTHRGNVATSTPGQLPVDSIPAELPQSTLFLQLASHGEDYVLTVLRRLVNRLGTSWWPVREVHSIEPVVPGMGHPLLHRPQRDSKLSSNLPHRLPSTNRLDHLATTWLLTVF